MGEQPELGKVYDFETRRILEQRGDITPELKSDNASGQTDPDLRETKPVIHDPVPQELFDRAVESRLEQIKAEQGNEDKGQSLGVDAKAQLQAMSMEANDLMSQMGPADQARVNSKAWNQYRAESNQQVS